MRHPLLLWTAVALLAAWSWWFASTGKAPERVAAVSREAPREVDYYLRGLHTRIMGPQGRLIRELEAEEVRHFPDDDTTELLRPRLTVHPDQPPPWVVVAENGWVSPDASLVLLNGEVRITREEGARNRPLRIDTRNLRVQPLQDYAETDERVRVRSRKDRIDAVGMQAWLRPPARLKFLADVKGYYAPP